MTELATAFPLALGPRGNTAMTALPREAAEQLIEELLFTDPGERLNRPTLGAGVIELIFDALTDELRRAAEFQVTSALQHWLADVIRVTSVTTVGSGSELEVTVSYRLAGAAEAYTVGFRR